MVKYTEQENQIPVTTALMDGIIETEFQKADGTLRKNESNTTGKHSATYCYKER